MSRPGESSAADALFAEHRRYLFAIAYRLLGVAEDAEDTLQEAWLRFSKVEHEEIENPRTYLATLVTRLGIDLLRSARRRREEYVGVWLPEPVETRDVLPDASLTDTESASFAFLLLLERLSPRQRAVLVLHDVFEYSHSEVAGMIGSTTAASRQTLRRARLALGDTKPTAGPEASSNKRRTERFLAAARSGDLEALLATLAPDVVLLSDGGGQVSAISRPLAGRDPVGRFLSAAGRSAPPSSVAATHLNGQEGLLLFDGGVISSAFLFDETDLGITAIYVVRNPSKLARLGRGLAASRE